MGWFMSAKLKNLHEYTLGTPKNLNGAIQISLMIGPPCDLNERLNSNIKDFLAQRFGAAYLRAETDSELQTLEKLWAEITGES